MILWLSASRSWRAPLENEVALNLNWNRVTAARAPDAQITRAAAQPAK